MAITRRADSALRPRCAKIFLKRGRMLSPAAIISGTRRKSCRFSRRKNACCARIIFPIKRRAPDRAFSPRKMAKKFSCCICWGRYFTKSTPIARLPPPIKYWNQPSWARNVAAIIVDFHAEATSEKMAMGQYLDARVSVVVGSHTHVPTADARILPKGTAYQTDAGMCGDYDSVIGFEATAPLERFLTKISRTGMEPAAGEATLCGTLVETDGYQRRGSPKAAKAIQYPEAVMITGFIARPKRSNFASELPIVAHTQPQFLERIAHCSSKNCAKISCRRKLSRLMDISEKLSMLNVATLSRISPRLSRRKIARQPLLAFKGDVYDRRRCRILQIRAILFSRRNMCVSLSGLYACCGCST